jgi:phage tail sheath protein FI
VYIEEVTGPGVIAGVGTSTAAFIGPALRGPINEARRITNFDRFIELYGVTRDNRPWPYLLDNGRPYHMAFGVGGFFANGGQYAYIVRVGTAAQASLPIQNQAGEDVFGVRALQDGDEGNNIQVETQQYAVQALATASATVTNVVVATITVDAPGPFQVGDFVTTDGANRAQINQIQGNDLILDAALAGAAAGDTLRIADIEPAQNAMRLVSTTGLYNGGTALISGDDAGSPGTTVTERVVIQNVNAVTNVVTLAAAPARTTTYNLAAAAPPTLTSVRSVARGQANVTGSSGTTVTVDDPSLFRPGDVVTSDGANQAQINQIQGNDLILAQTLAGLGATLRIADITPAQMTFRVADTTGLYPGTVVILRGDDANNPGTEVEEYAVIQAVNGAGFVTLEPTPARANTYNLDVADGAEPILIPQEFRLIVTPPPPGTGTATPERIENLSLNPYHPRYIFNTGIVTSDWTEVEEPDAPPTTTAYPGQLVALGGPTNLAGGLDDQPSGLTSVEYQAGLDVLRDVDDVNMICIPDAASHPEQQTIQSAMINHCLDLQDRIAILDSERGAPPSGPGSVEELRQQVTANRGFAALYYPWLMVRDPTSSGPQARTMFVPPSGYIAGVYARTDTERGVHKAPANTEVRGVLGVEQRLSDRQQGPLNLAGVNVLRIFPGTAQVVVWGARTTVDPIITDWLYVNVRRLMLYIEESIEEGIRWAVFEPNNLALWQKLKRTITEFLTRVWRDGALFGETADQAFYVRIDEALNPPATRNLGRLYIEIGLSPVRPAEFIIVRIGLWDGGSEVAES